MKREIKRRLSQLERLKERTSKSGRDLWDARTRRGKLLSRTVLLGDPLSESEQAELDELNRLLADYDREHDGVATPLNLELFERKRTGEA
jgi:hypothetical protein